MTTTTWFALQGSAFVCYFSWVVIAGIKRRYARPGSLERYRWNTVERLLRWPSLAFPVAPLVYPAVGEAPAWFAVPLGIVVALFAMMFWWKAWKQIRADDRDDDDDWFSRTGRKVRSWVTGLGRRPVTS